MTDMTHTLDALIAIASGDDGLPDDLRASVERLQVRVGRKAVPEGWKLVPAEPTREMLNATSWPGCAKTDYEHMLAAAPAEESSADAGEPRRFETPQEFVQWLRSVRAYGSDSEDTWDAAAHAATHIEDMLESGALCPACGSWHVYEDRVDQAKAVLHCDDCGHEFPNPESAKRPHHWIRVDKAGSPHDRHYRCACGAEYSVGDDGPSLGFFTSCPGESAEGDSE